MSLVPVGNRNLVLYEKKDIKTEPKQVKEEKVYDVSNDAGNEVIDLTPHITQEGETIYEPRTDEPKTEKSKQKAELLDLGKKTTSIAIGVGGIAASLPFSIANIASKVVNTLTENSTGEFGKTVNTASQKTSRFFSKATKFVLGNTIAVNKAVTEKFDEWIIAEK